MVFDSIQIESEFADQVPLERNRKAKQPFGRTRHLKAAALSVAFVALGLQPGFAAAKAKVIYQLPGQNAGEYPVGSLYQDKSGNLYGTSSGTIADAKKKIDYGSVFELSPPAAPGGGWKSTVLYEFQGALHGCYPTGGLVADQSGALYGTTRNCGQSAGVIFKLTPPTSGQTNWTESVILNTFGNAIGNLLPAKGGIFYAVTSECVYSITPPKKGQTQWTGTILYQFTSNATPTAGVVSDANGVLYVTTEYGTNGNGSLLSLTPPPEGQTAWTVTDIHDFKGGPDDGKNPRGNLVIDKNGALYGTTYLGGLDNEGTVYEFTPPAQGQTTWTESLLYSFDLGADGGGPVAGLTMLPNGNFYGTANGGAGQNGVVFELTPATGGSGYTHSVVYSFSDTSVTSPNMPVASLIRGANGALFGTSEYGGAANHHCGSNRCGTVYEVIP